MILYRSLYEYWVCKLFILYIFTCRYFQSKNHRCSKNCLFSFSLAFLRSLAHCNDSRQCFRCLRMTETVPKESACLQYYVDYIVRVAEVCEKYKHFLAWAYTCQRQTRTMWMSLLLCINLYVRLLLQYAFDWIVFLTLCAPGFCFFLVFWFFGCRCSVDNERNDNKKTVCCHFVGVRRWTRSLE